MPRPYDNDLRRMFLAAYAAGKGTQAELALVFGVSVGWAEKICRQHRLSGQPERIHATWPYQPRGCCCAGVPAGCNQRAARSDVGGITRDFSCAPGCAVVHRAVVERAQEDGHPS